MTAPTTKTPAHADDAFRGIRCVHLDLKGLPPTEPRLLQLLDLFAAAGFNAVLAEWEDSFPWTVDAGFRSETAYSRDCISQFHRRAAELGIEVIPLVQCLGHMETPLSLPRYAELRELPDRCDCLNPLAPGARALVQGMIDDVLALSPGIRRFHLGGDEVYAFGRSPLTSAFVEQHGKAALFLHHVEPLLDHLNARGIRPMLWHDMMIDWPDEALRRIGGKADLVVWGYRGHPDATTGHHRTAVIERFYRADVPLWGATAFKGADGSGDTDLPVPAERLVNAHGWEEVARRSGMVGVIATGWSRYSTHRVQCEPIDGALDVLVSIGQILRSGRELEESAIHNLLRAAGELARFEECWAALRLLTDARHSAWDAIRLALEERVVGKIDPRRRHPATSAAFVEAAQKRTRQAEEAGERVRRALNGLVHSVWVGRYLEERLAPLRGALREAFECRALVRNQVDG